MSLKHIFQELKGKRILITGATGLIGQSIIKYLVQSEIASDVKIIALARNKMKAERIFSGMMTSNFEILISDICSIQPKNMEIDYIIHGANQTSSKVFMDKPVETIATALHGTYNMLELARINPVKSFIYLSSMEIYGIPKTDEKVAEQYSGDLNTMEVRSCYPESKRICETLCSSYAKEFGVPAKVIRLTQTFGPGVEYEDGRVFAEFARCAIEGKDIILNTSGKTKRSYLYTEDAARAILTVLINGQVGEAYNAANEDTYCSIYEMACCVAERCSDKKIKVLINENANITRWGYAPTLHMNLDTAKIRCLGWCPTVGLEAMYINMIKDMKDNRIYNEKSYK